MLLPGKLNELIVCDAAIDGKINCLIDGIFFFSVYYPCHPETAFGRLGMSYEEPQHATRFQQNRIVPSGVYHDHDWEFDTSASLSLLMPFLRR